MKKNIYLPLASALLSFALILWLSSGIHLLDGRLFYSSYEAIGFLAENPQIQAVLWIDLCFFLPSYFLLGKALSRSNSALLFLSIAAAADFTETSLQIIGLHGIGLSSGWVPMAVSLSTPLKWLALFLWGSNLFVYQIRVWRR